MVGIDCADGGVDSVVPFLETGVCGVAGLVEGVVARDPGIAFVVVCEFFPEPDCAVLKVL